MAFSATEEDTALSYLHDLGFIPQVKLENEVEIRGFKVMLGGGLGSQPRHADLITEFLPTDELIPFIEGVLRIFDRHGERTRRLKARMKFLVNDIGIEAFLDLVKEEQKALSYKKYPITAQTYEDSKTLPEPVIPDWEEPLSLKYEQWKMTNIFPQKQSGFVSIGIKVLLGDFLTDQARQLAKLVKNYAGNEIRFTLRQNILIRDVQVKAIPFLYQELYKIGLADPGYNSFGDITACPGTDTCNLGIASSTGIAKELERLILAEYPKYLKNKDLTIKISGCMNACGQHNMAHIGFQGMSMKVGKIVFPALQVLLGGGTLGNGKGRFADKVIKIPSKRGPEALRILIKNFEAFSGKGESFLDYYDRKGQIYFYDILKVLTDTDTLTEADQVDWGNEEAYKVAVGVGECAGVVIDLIATLLLEAREKLDLAKESYVEKRWSDSIYHTYASLVNAAKAILLSENKSTNSYANIIALFDETFVESGKIDLGGTLADIVYQINKNEPTESFATSYFKEANKVFEAISSYREKEVLA